MDLGVPPEREESFANFLKTQENSRKHKEEQRKEEAKKQQLTTQISELKAENDKLKNHVKILEKAVISRQQDISELEDKNEQLEQRLLCNDLILPYKEFLSLVKNIDFSKDEVQLCFENEEDKSKFVKAIINALLEIHESADTL